MGWYQIINDRNYASVTNELGLRVKEDKQKVHRGYLKPQYLGLFKKKYTEI